MKQGQVDVGDYTATYTVDSSAIRIGIKEFEDSLMVVPLDGNAGWRVLPLSVVDGYHNQIWDRVNDDQGICTLDMSAGKWRVKDVDEDLICELADRYVDAIKGKLVLPTEALGL